MPPPLCALPAGANLDVDVPWKWLNFFMEDDAKLEQVRRRRRAVQGKGGAVQRPWSHGSPAAAPGAWDVRGWLAGSPAAPPTPTYWPHTHTLTLQIGREYSAGRMLTGEIKAELIALLTEMVERHNAARAAVTDDIVDAFMSVRSMPELWG